MTLLPPFADFRPSHSELIRMGLTPANTLMTRGPKFTSSQLMLTYSKRAQPGDNPVYRGLLDQNRVDRHEQYEALHFINNWCAIVGCSAVVDGNKIESALRFAPTSMVDRNDLQWQIWNTLKARTTLLA